MEHIQLTHDNCDDIYCNICNLFICSVCNQAEGDLESECPGAPIKERKQNGSKKESST